MMKKGSVFAGKKGALTIGTPVNMSSASSSFFDNSLPHMPPTGLTGVNRNWQATPMNSHRFPSHHYQQQSRSTSSIRVQPSVPVVVNTPTSNLINRVKPNSLQSLVENLNELLAELGIPFVLRHESKYSFEDILTILDHLTNPSRYTNHRFQPFPPLPQPTKVGGKVSLTDRWAYLKQVFLVYRLSTLEQLSRLKPERQMAHDQVMILLEYFVQLSTCLLKSDEEQERIRSHHYLNEFKSLMRQMFWIGRHDPTVMEESLHELRHHFNAKENLDIVDRLEHEKEMNERTNERDHLKEQAEELKKLRENLENECSNLTTSNENELVRLTKLQEETSDEQSKFVELTQIVEQKELDKKHLIERNETLSDKLFAQQTDVELQRHLRTNNDLKQQHELLLSTLLLEQEFHLNSSNEQKQLIKDLQENLGKYQILLNQFKHKSTRTIPSSFDIDLNDAMSNDGVRQTQIQLENFAKEIIAEEILLAQRQRQFEEETKQKIDELQAAERQWKSAAKNGQRRAAQQNELSRFQDEIRNVKRKIDEFERKIDEKKNATIETKKEFDRIKIGVAELFRRFEGLETNYLTKTDELENILNLFCFDQNQLAKTFRRDVEDLKRFQQEYLTKLDIHSAPLPFDELVNEQIRKYYHFHDEDEDEDEENYHRQRFIADFDKLHDEHLSNMKKKKREMKTNAPIAERLHEIFENLQILNESN